MAWERSSGSWSQMTHWSRPDKLFVSDLDAAQYRSLLEKQPDLADPSWEAGPLGCYAITRPDYKVLKLFPIETPIPEVIQYADEHYPMCWWMHDDLLNTPR